MNPKILFSVSMAAATALHGSISAQRLNVSESVAPGGVVSTQLSGPAGRGFVTLIDSASGPVRAFGEEIFLTLSASTLIIDAGVLGRNGRQRNYTAPLFPSPLGLTVFWQSAIDFPAAPNGTFLVSNSESLLGYDARAVMSERFDDPAAAGFTGNYDRTRRGRLMGARVTSRTVTVRPNGTPFGQPVLGELNPTGVRIQKVYRAIDLGATGTPEVLAQMQWEIRGAVQRDLLPQMIIDVSHSNVIPDFTVGSGSGLPQFPNSGLSERFADNVVGLPTRIFDGPYSIDPALAAGGYMPYPQPTRDFLYDGKSSLLLDFKNTPSAVTTGVNGQQIYLMVSSSARPDARALKTNTPNPSAETLAGTGDNSITGMRFVFAQVFSEAVSPWRQAPHANPDYARPRIAAAEPAGSSIEIEYRGATNAQGTNATAWVKDINILDGLEFVQYRVQFRASSQGAVPSIDTLIIPVN